MCSHTRWTPTLILCPDCLQHKADFISGLKPRGRCDLGEVPHRWILDTGEKVCEDCGLSDGWSRVDEFRPDKLIRRHVVYDPNEFMGNKANALMGWTSRELSGLRERLQRHHRACRTWYEVYELLDRWHQAEHLLLVPALLGVPLAVGSCMKIAAEIIYRDRFPFRLKFVYVCAKLAQLRRQEADGVPEWKWLPLKARKATHEQNEKRWKTVCETFGLPFIRIRFKDLVTPWATP